jgi:hypothetical protein
MSTKYFKNVGLETTKGAVIHALKDEGAAGTFDYAVLDQTGIAVDQDTFTIGDDVYEVNVILTDTGSESVAQVEVGDTSIVFDTQPTIAPLPGDVLRMESEYMIVLDYNANGTGSVNVVRGAFGSTEAQHTILNSDTFQAAQPVAAGNFAVPTDDTAAAAFVLDCAAAVQFWTDGGYRKGLGGGIGVTVQNGLKVDAFSGVADSVVFAKEANGSVGGALSEAMTNATIDAAFNAGVEPASQVYSRVMVKAAGTGALTFCAPWAVDEAYVTLWGADGAIIEAAANTVAVSGRLVTVSAAGSLAAGVSVEVVMTAA